MHKFGISLFLMISFLHIGYTQKKEAWVEAADHAFTIEKDYYKAFKYYEAALKYEKDSSDVLRLLYQKAEAARLINAYFDARNTYLELVRRAPADSIARSSYRCAWAYLGELQLSLAYSATEPYNQEVYEKAQAYFAVYDSLSVAGPGNCDDLVAQGKALIAFAAKGAGRYLTNEQVNVENAGPKINSSFPDFAPMSWGQRLYFTSFREQVRGKGIQAGRYFSRIYVSNQGAAAQALPGINPSPEDTFHIGHTALNKVQDRIYFTRCEYIDGTLTTRCDLYYHQLDRHGNPMGNPIEVSELNLNNSTLTQPAIAWDPIRQLEVLFFASNRPGTRGGMDIWKSELVNDHFTTPTNELLINTKGNEMTPFYQDGLLYFSSDGLPERYGGYDIFFSTDPQKNKPVNLGQKINSSADELYYSRNEDGNVAYFSSNRPAMGAFEMTEKSSDDQEASSLDIYYYPILAPVYTLEVVTFSNCSGPHERDLQALEDASVVLFDITEAGDVDGQPGIEPVSRDGNSYLFDTVLRPGRKYLIIGTAEGFEVQRQELDFTTNSKPYADGLKNVKLYFSCDKPLLQVQVYHHNQEMPEAMVRILVMPDSVQILSTSATQKTVTGSQLPCSEGKNLYTSYPNEKKIKAFSGEFPLEFEQTYLIIIDPGLSDSLLLSSTTYQASRHADAFCGMSCRDTLRIDLEGLPTIPLFFDNASPGPDPYDVSGLSYLMAYDRYKNKKAEYLKHSEVELDLTQRAEIELFFNNELDRTPAAFFDFAQQATDLLCQNIPLTIEVKGCTTPNFNTQTRKQMEYMRHLVNRRIESVQQDLIGLGLSTERWPDLYRFEPILQECAGSSRSENAANEKWQDNENTKLIPFSMEAALARRVELKLKIGRETEN